VEFGGVETFERLTSLIGGSNKEIEPFKTLAPARYRKGLRGRWSAALVPVEGGRAALEAIVGVLAAFELVLQGRQAETEIPPTEAVPINIVVEAAGAAAGAAVSAAEGARMFVMGVDPPFDLPQPPAAPPERVLPLMAVLPAPVPPDAAARLALASIRLETVRPPRMWGDWTDPLRVDTWRARCAAARARYPQDHQAQDPPQASASG
jgi:hypothetical protein